MLRALFLLPFSLALAQAPPAGPNVIKDTKGLCQIVVPPDWVPLSASNGAAVFHDASTAIAVVTSQPGQAFRPMPESMIKLLALRKERMFENTAKRIFYQDKTSANSDDPSAFSASVPANKSTCSCRVVFLPSIGEDVARKIIFSLAPVASEPPDS